MKNSNYYQYDGRMSNSVFKGFLECAERQNAIIKGKYKEEKQCFTDGHFIEEMLIGDKDESKFPEIWKNSNSRYVRYDRYLEGIEQLDSSFLDKLNGDHQKEVTFDFAGFKWKGLLDIFDGQVRDLKTCGKPLRTLTYDKRYGIKVPNYIKYGYHYQLALYAYGTGSIDQGAEILSFVKETNPQQTERIIFSPDMLQETLDEIMSLAPIVKELMIELPRCGECEYCQERYPHTEEHATMHYKLTDL